MKIFINLRLVFLIKSLSDSLFMREKKQAPFGYVDF